MMGVPDLIEHRQAEDALHESEEEFRRIAENTIDVIFELNLDGTIRYDSPASERVLGYKPEEVTGRSAEFFFSDSELPKLYDSLAVIANGKNVERLEIEMLRKDGSRISVEINASPILREGRIVGALGILRDITERKLAGNMLMESEERFRRITENMLDMVVQTDLQGICEYASPSFKTVLGYDPKHVLGRSLFELVHPDDFNNTLEIVLKALANSSAATFDYRCKHADGHYVWLQSVGNPIFDKTGQISGTVLATRDITERKRADDALRESEAKYRSLIEQSLQGITIAQGAPPHLVFTNPAFAQMLGYTPDELTSLSPKETEALVHPEDRAFFFGRFSDRLQGKPTPSNYEFRGIRKDGEVRSMETSSNRIEYHGQPALQSTFIDITERKKAENALKESEERYKAIFDGASDGFLAADVKTSKFVFANPKICEMTGYSLKELLELSVNEIHPKKEVPFVIEQFERQARGMIDVAKEIPVLRKDKTVLYCDINSKIIEIKGQRCLLGIFRDVTERRQVERLKDQFVSMVSHELRTPLTSIRASLGLLASGVIGAVPEEGQRMLDIAVTNTDRLVRLINDILDSERLASGKTPMEKKQCSTAQLVKQASDVMKPMAEKAGVSLSVECQDAELWVDPDRIVQALTNLISNAIKFSSKGSKICVVAERKENQMLFKVQDKGQGISPDKLGLLFERFQQLDSSDAREKGGSGLGLSISRSIIEQHNGKIWVESTVGKGSTFLFTLPLTQETQIPAQPEATTEAQSACKILIIEDDPDLVNILKAMLQRHDIQLYIALTGEKGITLSKQLRPDVIVLDLGLPDMDGSAVVHALREDNALRLVPLVVYTARELDKQQRENLRLGETLFFTKSRIPPDQFEEKVVQFVKHVLEHRGKTNAS